MLKIEFNHINAGLVNIIGMSENREVVYYTEQDIINSFNNGIESVDADSIFNAGVNSVNTLTTQELYDLLQLRSEVFVVEQDCVYQDIDSKDQKSLHILGLKNNKIIEFEAIPNGLNDIII